MASPIGTGPLSLTCQTPGPPIITGERPKICQGETVKLTATGCLGTVIWSTGEQGAGIRVTPYQTTRYTAICRLPEGCLSCFADAYTVTVGTPEAPKLTTDTPTLCAGDAATITAANCAGTIRWSDSTLTGATPTVRVQQTTVYQATCLHEGCASIPSVQLALQVATPNVPTLVRVTGEGELCAGQSVQLAASECAGQVRWSDGAVGTNRTFTPSQSIRLRAICQVGTCRSDSSNVLMLAVQPARATPLNQTLVQNTCPFLTADLSTAIGPSFQPSLAYVFRTGPTIDSPEVAAPGAVLAGMYYVSARNRAGCLSQPVAVSVLITTCANGIAPCLSSPHLVSLSLDSLDQKRGVVCLKARLRGVGIDAIRLDSAWTCSGTGLFTDQKTLRPRYVASESDRQRGTVTFALITPDPDGAGPCVAGMARLAVTLSQTNTPATTDSTNLVVKQPDVIDGGSIFIPEGFSPNGDGINDYFVVQGTPRGATVDLEIFNRWGHRVYADTNYKNDWGGQTNQGINTTANQGLPDGTYFYVVRISDGREYVRFLTIAR
ncbi:gliding motility-associated C-terminal domain-containing protein [Fibrella forsythiae]|uniref:gliding motility-associated C-terminal domain-containing protein n=1 Tax=Fibrella forsythiae TaxID=2817061 RepID=UPI001E4889B2|nr:gliding motility-associated C-terminal domain-containing protein [Fibrella forsythiae]